MDEAIDRRSDAPERVLAPTSVAIRADETVWTFLPTADSREVPHERFLGALQAALARDEGRFSWQVRIAAITQPGGTLHPFLTVLSREPVGPALTNPDCELQLGAVRLISRSVDARNLESLDALKRILSPDMQEPTAELGHGTGLWTQRRPSHFSNDSSIATPPTWVAQWDYSPGNNPSLPQERLLSTEYGMFFEGIAHAAAAWTGQLDMAAKNHTAPCYRIVIPDERAWFTDVITEDGGVRVVTSSHRAIPLFCAIRLKTVDGIERRIVEGVNGSTVIRLPASPNELSLHLFDAQGTEYDWLYRRPYPSRAGVSLFDASTGLVSRAVTDLDSARDTGENDTVEFKPAIKPTRKGNSDKIAELLETVVAFANASGGSIYIGVDDNGRVTGANAELASYAPVAKGETIVQRELYATYLKGMIAEGVQPTISVDMTWTDYSGLSVLRVAVPRGVERPYILAANDAIYVRRGATNRAATRSDVLELARIRGIGSLAL